MKSSQACRSLLAASRSFGFVPLALLTCCAVACGGGGKTSAGGPSLDATSGEDGGYGQLNSSSGGSSGGSSSGSNESGVEEESGADGSSDDGSGGDSSNGAADGGEGGSTSSSSGGADGGGSSDGGGADSGGDSSGASSGGADSGGVDSGDSSSSDSSSSGGADSGDSSSSSGGSSSGGSSSGSSSGGGSSGSSSGDAATDTGTTCNLTGAWALRVDVLVTWQSTAILAAGGGTVQLWALVQGTQSGDSIPGSVLPCGIALPDFNGPAIVGSPIFGVAFPNSLFDGTFLTATSSTLTVGSSAPGATFSSPAEANLIGIAFANQATTAWPSLATAQSEQVDMDMDGNPGVTALSKAGQTTESDSGTYAAIPVEIGIHTADQLYMALRSVIALNGTLTSCTAASGAATVSHIDDHTLGCHLTGGGTCSTAGGNLSQAAFVDNNSPVFAVTSATFQAQMLTTGSCPDVRAALP